MYMVSVSILGGFKDVIVANYATAKWLCNTARNSGAFAVVDITPKHPDYRRLSGSVIVA